MGLGPRVKKSFRKNMYPPYPPHSYRLRPGFIYKSKGGWKSKRKVTLKVMKPLEGFS